MTLKENQQKAAAKEFAQQWAGKGDEKQDTHRFWIGFLQKVLGVENADDHIVFEKPVKYDGHTTYIDAYIPETHILIEQKSVGIDLDKPEPRHGEMLTPFKQAEQYSQKLIRSQKARYIIVSNFESFRIHDLDAEGFENTYEEIKLCDLEKECHRFEFIIDKDASILQREGEISLKAGALVGKLYDAILKQYKNPDNPETLRSLNMLCVRLVFCLYAEDAGVFGTHEMFGQYLRKFPAGEVRPKLIELFKVLDTKPEDRDPYMDDALAAFPYVNGGLFAEQNIEIPRFTDEIVDLLLDKASAGFDWSDISPTIFGAAFESTLNPETRRSGGMHYTSIENIHKVIDPLFLDDLKTELAEIKALKVEKTRNTRLAAFTNKLSELTFLDPACGSGNFLTESYLSLRNLENEALEAMHMSGQTFLEGFIKVSIGQFYGIEINDFAVSVAKTALWIAEHQKLLETEKIIEQEIDFLPLKSYTNITEGNALRIDWSNVIAPEKLNYIMGNPPFVGANNVSKEQKAELFDLFGDKSKAGLLDYVAGWYIKATNYIKGTHIKAAFVSTNSITQGEQVAILWKPLSEKDIHINFAYQPFKWSSESNDSATVHCVIIGFSNIESEKRLFSSQAPRVVKNINGYLIDAPDIFIERKNQPICDVPKITKGCQPTDGGNLIIEAEDYEDFIKREPNSKKYIKKLVGAKEFLHNINRYCLWLVGVSPSEIKSMPLVMERVQKCKEMREKSSDKGTQRLALTPTLFRETYNLDNYIIVPSHTSEARKYIPIGYSDGNTISTNANLIIQNATLYHFGVLTSNVHNAWIRAVCGRLEMRYRYSKEIVYNNFPWCDPTPEQKAKIEETAQGILDARAKYPDCSLANLYDEVTMPPELRKAHQANDVAVMKAYGLSPKDVNDEGKIVAFLFEKYREITEGIS